MNIQASLSAFDVDKQKYYSGEKLKLNDMLVHAARKSGRSALSIGKEFSALNRSFRKITIEEYLRWGLYDNTRFDDAARAEFISADLHWKIAHKVNGVQWQSCAEDKVMAATIMTAGGVAVPETVAVIDRSQRAYPGIAKASDADALRDIILGLGTCELFGKLLGGMVSFGAFRVLAADQTHITCDGHDPITYQSFINDFLGQNAYLLQRRLNNHADLTPFASGIATVRIINMVRQKDIYNPLAIISLPQGANVADTLWRDGNISCAVDLASGRIQTVVRLNGHGIDFLRDHPTTAGLMGRVLPLWDKVIEVNTAAARLFQPIKYQSTDIAITQDGPVVVELNYGSGFGQNATGRGFLTPEVGAFLAEHDALPGKSSAPAASKQRTGFRLFGKRT